MQFSTSNQPKTSINNNVTPNNELERGKCGKKLCCPTPPQQFQKNVTIIFVLIIIIFYNSLRFGAKIKILPTIQSE